MSHYIQNLKVVQKLHATFKSGKSKPIDFRKQQLMKLKDLLDENTDVILGAMKEDLGKVYAMHKHYKFIFKKILDMY